MKIGTGHADAGVNLPVSNDVSHTIFGTTTTALDPAVYPNYTTVVTNPTTGEVDPVQTVDPTTNTRGGRFVPDGWLVTRTMATDHGGRRGQHRQPGDLAGRQHTIGDPAADRPPCPDGLRRERQGREHLGLYRMPDATVFSIDVAVAKARNVAYYADTTQLQSVDRVATVPAGTALTSRTFRYLAEPRFPEGIDGFPPGPFSILTDGGTNPLTALNTGTPLAAAAFQSARGTTPSTPGPTSTSRATP